MKDTKVYKLLILLAKSERKKLEKFIQSPYFNHQKEISILYSFFQDFFENNTPLPDKKIIYKKIHPKFIFNDQQFRLYMSVLFKLTEKFLIVEELNTNEIVQRQFILKSYNTHNHSKNFHKNLEESKEILTKTTQKNADFYFQSYTLEKEALKEKKNFIRTADYNFQSLSNNLDTYFIIEKLKNACELLSHENVSDYKYNYGLLEVVFQFIKENNLDKNPAIFIYQNIYNFIKTPEKITKLNFDTLLEIIEKNVLLFTSDELREVLIHANNFCVNMLNKGNTEYFEVSFKLYNIGIKSGAFLEKGYLSRFTYKNIVTVGLRTKQYEWTEQFIEKYKENLEQKFQESSYSYNKAYLEYERKNFDLAIMLLQKADYDDVLLNLAAKNILMKIYFELNYIDALEYLVGGIMGLVKRKKIEQVYKQNYLNICAIVKRLIALKTSTASQKKTLPKKKEITAKIIETTKPLTEKKWLLEQLELIK